MVDHDSAAKALQARILAEKISQEFSQNSTPSTLVELIFKLAEEREQTKRELQKISEKFDQIMLELKTRNSSQAAETQTLDNGRKFLTLPEQDQKILTIIEQKGPTSALEIQKALNYSGMNAASQRLNNLYRQGFLKKIQSGKKVLFFTTNSQ